MKNTFHLFTSESVSEGHPDKIADQISDAILDAILAQDHRARVACETFVKTGMVFIGGEISTSAWVDVEAIARHTIRKIGYTNTDIGFDADSCAVLVSIGKQSADIAQGVDRVDDFGAGDQGLMFGFACDETPEYMPAPIAYAHQLVKRQSQLRHSRGIAWLRPDAKSQVTLRYDGHTPVGVDTVVFSTQHDPDVTYDDLREAVIEEIIKPTFPSDWLTDATKFLVNPTGRFVIGGPLGDCGLTGRKIIVDTYGGMARHGGGCFSGKDPTKVDRTASYYARYVAKHIVACGFAQRCEIQVSYAIGVVEPTSINLNTFGTGALPDEAILKRIHNTFDFRPKAMIESLDLLRPIYEETATYGHFGRDDLLFPWEQLDRESDLCD